MCFKVSWSKRIEATGLGLPSEKKISQIYPVFNYPAVFFTLIFLTRISYFRSEIQTSCFVYQIAMFMWCEGYLKILI